MIARSSARTYYRLRASPKLSNLVPGGSFISAMPNRPQSPRWRPGRNWYLAKAHCRICIFMAFTSPLSPLLVEYLEACLVRPPGDPVGGPMHVDGALSMFRSFHPEFITLIAQPPLASQRSSRSDISARSFESVAGLRQAISLARKAKWLLRVSR